MKTVCTVLLALAVMTLPAGPVRADETGIVLKYDIRRDLAVSRCIACHSLDYIPGNARLDRLQWSAVVTKMVEVFGADIDENEAQVIVGYLADRYGK